MYYYIYDSFLSDKKYDRVLAKIENRLANFEINGKITKLSKLKSAEDNVLEEIASGVKNIIVAGDDSTVLQILNIVVDYDDIAFGIIPVGEKNEIAKLLGVPYGEDACEVLSSRKIERIDLGMVNNKYFISKLDFGYDSNLEVVCNDTYSIKSIVPNEISICNIANYSPLCKEKNIFNPKDGFLEVFVGQRQSFADKLFNKEKRQESIFPIKNALVKSGKTIKITVDRDMVLKSPLSIRVAPQKLRVIVGRDRVF